MDIHNYTQKIKGAIKSYPDYNDIDHGSDIFLSKLDEYFPQDSLVFLGGRPRTGKTSLILDLIAKNSLKQESTEMEKVSEASTKRGLAYMIGHKEKIVLKRWLSIATQSTVDNHENDSILNYKIDEYSKAIEGATIDLNFISSVEGLFPTIESEIKSYNPDYVVIDGLNISPEIEKNPYQLAEQLDKLINLQKKSNKFLIISTNLGHEAYHRGGGHRHILEDFNSTQIESEADIALLLHRPELYGIECDEEGYSMKGVVDIETAINRYGNESETTLWHGIHEIPKLGKLRAMVS